MPSVSDRDDFLRAVNRLLPRPDFQARLSACGANGTTPVVAAMRDETIDILGVRVRAIGGAANVAVPMYDGLVVFQMRLTDVPKDESSGAEELRAECTVGLLLQRLLDDGGHAKYIVNTHPVSTPTSSGALAEHPRVLAFA